MELTVNLYGELKTGRKPVFALRVSKGTSMGDIARHLRMADELPLAIVVNGQRRQRSYLVEDGDVVSLFSMAAFSDTMPS